MAGRVAWARMATDRYHWAPGWTEDHSRSYGLREDQDQLYMDQPEQGYWWNMPVKPGKRR